MVLDSSLSNASGHIDFLYIGDCYRDYGRVRPLFGGFQEVRYVFMDNNPLGTLVRETKDVKKIGALVLGVPERVNGRALEWLEQGLYLAKEVTGIPEMVYALAFESPQQGLMQAVKELGIREGNPDLVSGVIFPIKDKSEKGSSGKTVFRARIGDWKLPAEIILHA